MQEKYNKKLLTMKMLKTQKWAGLKKKAGRWQFQGSFRAVAVSMAVKKKRAAKQFHRPSKQKHNYKSNEFIISSSKSM